MKNTDDLLSVASTKNELNATQNGIFPVLSNAQCSKEEKYFTVQVSVQVHVALRAKKFQKNLLQGVNTCVILPSLMANQPDINKRLLSVRISREAYRQLEKRAVETKMEFADYLRFLVWNAVDDVPLTKEDYDLIEAEKQFDLANPPGKRKAFKKRLPKA